VGGGPYRAPRHAAHGPDGREQFCCLGLHSLRRRAYIVHRAKYKRVTDCNGTGRNSLFVGYLVGACAIIIGDIAAIIFGVAAEGRALEDVASPLPVIRNLSEAIFRAGSDRPGIAPTATGIKSSGFDPGAVPEPRLAEHDDPARTRPDDSTPLAQRSESRSAVIAG
jgi:hypothetical protein